jgi:hypothetical protein
MLVVDDPLGVKTGPSLEGPHVRFRHGCASAVRAQQLERMPRSDRLDRFAIVLILTMPGDRGLYGGNHAHILF